MAVPTSNLRAVLYPAIQTAFDEYDRLIRTPEGRETLACRLETEADRLTRGALYPRYPLPAAVVADTLKYARQSRIRAMELRAIVGNKGAWEI